MTATTVRSFAVHVPQWQRFQQKSSGKCAYDRQYSHVYSERLTLLGPRVAKRMEKNATNTNTTFVHRILELCEDKPSSVCGTLVYEDEDAYLEDESGRVALALETPVYCTGAVVGVSGVVGKDGVLKVEKLYTPSIVKECSAPPKNADASSPLILVLSGLECGNPNFSSFSRDMLLSYIQGVFGMDTASRVAHIVVAGGLISKEASGTAGCRELDAWCWNLTQVAHIPVTLVPGSDDPTTANWPQRPLHPALLPRSENALLHRTPNPMAAQLCECAVIATDGANAKTLTELYETLECAHICPQGPVKVPMVPHADPMVMKTCPHLYVAGNCAEFATQLVQVDETNCRLLCLPPFCSTGMAALVDPTSLDVELLRFDASGADE